MEEVQENNKLNFISNKNFEKHVYLTIKHYGDKLTPYNLEKLNNNIVDPVKLIFDKTVYRYSWDEIIKNEIFRQRDKSNNNDIGYFHQGIFKYIKNCTVPNVGWDVIFKKSGKDKKDERINMPDGDSVKTIFVEMKNKHNTMNSASSSKTYMKMQSQLLTDDDCICCLVEVIAKQSQNIAWSVSIDGVKQKHRRIRRISIDKFYEIVTGEPNAFYKICLSLPSVIENVVENMGELNTPNDTALDELIKISKEKDNSMALALYMLGFGIYNGFAQN